MTKKVITALRKNKRNIISFLLLMGIGVFCYYKTLFIGFLSDDFHMLSIAKEFSPFWKYFSTNIIGERVGSSYGPIMNIFFELEYTLFGLQAFWYHVVSTLFFVSTGFLLAQLVYKLSKNYIIGIGSGILFLLLPNHVEAVSWIAVLPHLFATFLFLLGIYFYFLFMEKEENRLYIFSFIFFTASLLTKEIGITFIGILFLLELFFGKRNITCEKKILRKVNCIQNKIWKEKIAQVFSFVYTLVKRLAPFLVLLGTYIFLRAYATGSLFGYYAKPQLEINIAKMWHMFLELGASMFVSFEKRLVLVKYAEEHIFLFFILIGLILGFSFWRAKKQRKQLLFFVFSYCIVSLPYLDLLLNPINNEGERYAYLMSVFFAPAVALVLYQVFSHMKSQKELFFLGILCTNFLFFPQIQKKVEDWRSAGVLTQGLLESAKELKFIDGEYTYFIGIPDNVAGAQVMRNAVKEALHLFSQKEKISGERILLFTYFNNDTLDTKINIFQENGKIVLREENNKRVFTGFPEWKTQFATFSLEEFEKVGNTGTGIVIEGDVLENIQDITFSFLFVSEGKFHKVYLENIEDKW
ncbi:MAG: hypothetical protein V1848_04085 [Candidatus Magasanikbacteria bacterium]